MAFQEIEKIIAIVVLCEVDAKLFIKLLPFINVVECYVNNVGRRNGSLHSLLSIILSRVVSVTFIL